MLTASLLVVFLQWEIWCGMKALMREERCRAHCVRGGVQDDNCQHSHFLSHVWATPLTSYASTWTHGHGRPTASVALWFSTHIAMAVSVLVAAVVAVYRWK